MNSASGDSESGESNSSIPGEEKNIIDTILGEMKCQFNKTEKKSEDGNSEEVLTENVPEECSTPDSSPLKACVIQESDEKTDGNVAEAPIEPNLDTTSTNPDMEEAEDKPRIVMTFKKPNAESPKPKVDNGGMGRRSLRHKPNSESDQTLLKRSARRRSKDCNESVLQSAIARKEKSYNESNKPQRLTRQLKPTQKILENLALAKQERTKVDKSKPTRFHEKQKNTDSDSYTETDAKSEDNERSFKKRKHKHHNRTKKTKRIKGLDTCKYSDSDESLVFEEKNKVDERRSRRISSSRTKDESTDLDEESVHDLDGNDSSAFQISVEQHPVSRLCLCTEKTRYHLAIIDGEDAYCGAVDSVSNKIVGCSRLVDMKETMMMRPSTRIPYTPFCSTHRNRLLRHNCCPTCGIFCTQGRFVECENRHQYHRNCQIIISNIECCPHCALPSPDYDITITMHTSRKPTFLPIQKSQYISAKMTFQNSTKIDDRKCITPPLVPFGTLDLKSTEFMETMFDSGDLLSAVKDHSLDRLAAIISSKSVDLMSAFSEHNDETALHFAAKKGLISIVHMLVIAGAQMDVFDKEQNTPLMLAILMEKYDVVQYLIKAGASIDIKGTDGMTSLHLAAKCGSLRACELLLTTKTSLKTYVNGLDDGGWTPLVWACEHGFADIATFLIEKGADANLRDVEHNIALHWAAFSGSCHIAELLLNKGCDINAVNAHGDTPLHIGARQDMYNCIIVLLARGADVTLLNNNNESVLDCVPSGGDCYSPISLNITLQIAVEDNNDSKVILTNDISRGKESNPIQCFNNVDRDPTPVDFRYITKNCLSSDDVRVDTKINLMQACKCEGRCVEEDCYCGKLSVRCWYDESGKLISQFNFNDIPMIFECNDRCPCNAITCNNRVVQKGLTQRFQLFKTAEKGWGIRTLRHIPKGNFVCEYVGEIITDVEADKREDDSFLFDLENRVCKNIYESDAFCIDAKFYGNVSRFINHSCNPNLTSVKVFIDHQDLRFPRIAFFANRDILCDEELSFDYGEKFWIAKYKSFFCVCRSPECKYSEDTIESTIENYQRRLRECS